MDYIRVVIMHVYLAYYSHPSDVLNIPIPHITHLCYLSLPCVVSVYLYITAYFMRRNSSP